MHIGIAADNGGSALKVQLTASLKVVSYEVEDFGAYELVTKDDYMDFVVPMAMSVARGAITLDLSICGRRKCGADHGCLLSSFMVEDDDMNVMCLGGLITGYATSWDLIQTFLSAYFKGDERFRHRLAESGNVGKGEEVLIEGTAVSSQEPIDIARTLTTKGIREEVHYANDPK